MTLISVFFVWGLVAVIWAFVGLLHLVEPKEDEAAPVAYTAEEQAEIDAIADRVLASALVACVSGKALEVKS